MTSRRTYQGAQPLLEIRRDEVEPACTGRWDVYDMLIDPRREDRHRIAFAAREARSMCSECPIRRTCWTENRDEEWLLSLVGKKATRKVAAIPSAERLTEAGRAKIRANNSEQMARFNAARVADLEAFVAAGVTAGQAAQRLGIERETLRMWCHRHNRKDLWKRLQGVAA